jgi:hypothetical protein
MFCFVQLLGDFGSGLVGASTGSGSGSGSDTYSCTIIESKSTKPTCTSFSMNSTSSPVRRTGISTGSSSSLMISGTGFGGLGDAFFLTSVGLRSFSCSCWVTKSLNFGIIH